MIPSRPLPIADDDPRRGIALIMVLGILVILIVLAGAFAVTMRVERLAAKNSIDGVRARMLMPAAIQQAMGQLNGSLYSEGTLCVSVNENQDLWLTPPPGTVITSIDFASYGSSTGSCGNYSYSSCHALDTQAIVERIALGATTVPIRASNAVFGDPCGGTAKRLTVQFSYGSIDSQVYSSSNVVAASSTISAAGYYDVDNLYSAGDAKQYIPDVLRLAGYGVSDAVADADWLTLFGSGVGAVGRYTFVAADCSGFLDANYAIGDPSGGRAEGSIPEEMILGNLGDVSSQSTLYNSLVNDVIRFDNYQEFKSLAAGLSGYPDNFFHYSRNPVSQVIGQTVRIFNPDRGYNQEYLHLRELEVYSGGVNVALNQPATQASSWGGVPPSRANDGNLGSISHSNRTGPGGEWWEVDLGAEYPIDEIVLYNRSDCCQSRLYDYTVEVRDAAGTVVWSDGPNLTPPGPSHVATFKPSVETSLGVATHRVPLDGGVADLTGRAYAITNALAGMGLAAEEAALVYTNLLDYVDADRVPRDFASSATESVPMFNEFWQETTVDNINTADTNMEFLVTVDAELFYPFVTADSTTYEANIASVTATITVEDDAGNSATGSVSATTFVGADRPYAVGEYYSEEILNDSVIVELDSTVPPVQLSNSTVKVEISLSGAEVHAGAAVVDQLADGIVIVTNTAPAIVSAGIDINSGADCLDPRFNYAIADTNYWTATAASSLDAINAWTSAFINDAATFSDGDTAMYVKDGPLYVVGELGYLAIAPWQTIKLYNNGNGIYDPVHDHFAMSTDTAYGLVNPNTDRQEVLAAVFNNMPIDQYPGETPSHRITWGEAGDIASDIMSQQNFVNVSDVIADNANYVNIAAANAPLNAYLDNELKRESLYRNAADLLSPRNNVITMLLLVQAGEDRNGNNYIEDDEVNATEKAAVVLWRDPYPQGGYHPFFVHQIRRLY